MKASDLSDERILSVLRQHEGRWHTSLGPSEFMPHVYDPAYPDAPRKVLTAKLRSMKRRGLINGCECGCRGNWFVGEERLWPAWHEDKV